MQTGRCEQPDRDLAGRRTGADFGADHRRRPAAVPVDAAGASDVAAAHNRRWFAPLSVLGRTLSKAWNDRILGLSAEAAFWQLLSLPPLLLALLGSLGYLTDGPRR
ncbi:MAG: hypothetical protein WKF47_04675 [Geodermatophilaceae bacterium]